MSEDGWPPSFPHLGQAFTEARERRGLTRRELGQKVRMPTARVRGIEQGKPRPTVTEVARLGEALGMSMTQILGRASELEHRAARAAQVTAGAPSDGQ
jgi:transcriptional regulator with XRE-family HTH domain